MAVTIGLAGGTAFICIAVTASSIAISRRITIRVIITRAATLRGRRARKTIGRGLINKSQPEYQTTNLFYELPSRLITFVYG
jgi:hypothetical protein